MGAGRQNDGIILRVAPSRTVSSLLLFRGWLAGRGVRGQMTWREKHGVPGGMSRARELRRKLFKGWFKATLLLDEKLDSM